jgi:membrane peptidoglycan carboxypeptidase
MVLGATGASAAGAAWFVAQLPSTSRFHIHYAFQDARIYDSQGNLLYDMPDLNTNGGLRIVEPLQPRYDHQDACRGGVDRIPLTLQNATIATEDATFYQNPGVDPLSIVRAAYQDWSSGRIVSGASTITQQLVRATMLNDARTIGRKANEIALAYEISRLYSKRTLLWYYLNTVNYGNLAYGAEAAARVYFNEPACRLDFAQAALIAGLPDAPSLNDPVIHRSTALARLHVVLSLMLSHHVLRSRAQFEPVMREARSWHFFPAAPTMRDPAFVRYALGQLQAVPSLQRDLYRGIDVYTTLDPGLQSVAQSLVTKQIDGLTAQHVTDGALVALDLRHQHYGWILSMIGSAHGQGQAGQVNMAIQPRQPGSSMKPFNYIWAFTHAGVGPGTLVNDSPITLPDPGNPLDGGIFAPIDYDHQFHGTLTVRQALANSLNVPAVKTEYYVTGIAHVAQTATDFGMASLYSDNPGLACGVCYALTLGGLARGTRPLEETSAYGVFATDGWKVPPVAIWKVVLRRTNKVLYCSADCPAGVRPDATLARQQQRVLDAAHAYEMTSVLSDNGARCTPQVCEFGPNSPLLLSRPAAAKTGTTNDWTDNWTVGYTPQIIAGVWVGNADRSPMVNVNGITGAAPIWHDFMESAFRMLQLPVLGFVEPPHVTHTSSCTPAGSHYTAAGTPDIYVRMPGDPAFPLCAIPESGSSPLICERYETSPYSARPQCVLWRASQYGEVSGPGSLNGSNPAQPGQNDQPSPFSSPP